MIASKHGILQLGSAITFAVLTLLATAASSRAQGSSTSPVSTPAVTKPAVANPVVANPVVATPPSAVPIVVTPPAGALKGTVSGAVARFLGIPYAAPPVGELRWRLPRRHAPWQGTRDATAFGAICPQPSGSQSLPASSEDCLFLNVYAPSPLRPGHRVMVWVHGGTNTTGAGSFYDPTPLATAGDVIVVTLNYRLGALGFLAQAALQAESRTTGNYGLADQQQALRWVRDDIAAFGGDPHDVTLFGESSGGMNVISQLISPPAAGLFQKAIIESGAFLLDTPRLALSEARGHGFARAIGCPDQSATCLRGKSVDEVLAKQGNPEGGRVAYELATVDGMILPTSQRVALTAGRFARIPVLFGNNAQEGRLFVPPNLTAADYPSTLAGYAKAAHRPVPGVLQAYPLAAYATPADGAAAAYGDATFACTDRLVALLLSSHVPAYEYEFDDDAGGTAPLGPTHGSELRYLFDVTNMGPVLDGSLATLPPASQALSLAMRRYWTAFARTNAPDQPHLAVWLVVPSGNIQLLVAPEPRPSTAASFVDRHRCGYWN